MGKEFKNIDDLFRSELGSEHIEAPEFIKSSIDRELGFNNTRKGLAFVSIFALIVGTVGAIYSFYPTDQTRPALTSQTSRASITYHVSTELNQTSNATQDNSKHKLIKHQREPLLAINQPTVSSAAQNNLESYSSVVNITSTLQEKDTKRLAESSPEKVSSVDGSDDYATSTIELIDVVQENEDTAGKEAQSAEGNIINETSKQSEENSFFTAIDRVATFRENPEPNQFEQSEAPDLNQTILTDSTNYTEDTQLEDVIRPLPVKPWMFGMTAGLNKVNTAFTALEINDKTTYENASTDKLGFQANFDVTYRLNNGLAFGTGLGYTKFNEDVVFNRKVQTTTTIKETEYIYDYEYKIGEFFQVDTNGYVLDSATIVLDSNYVVVDSTSSYSTKRSTDSREFKEENTVTYIHIPVSFGTQMVFNRVQLDLFAMVRMNFRTNSRGIYQKNDAIYSYTNSNSIYKPFFVDVTLGTKLHYNMWRNVYATANVQYRPVIGYALGNVPFNKSFDYTHVGIGVSIRL